MSDKLLFKKNKNTFRYAQSYQLATFVSSFGAEEPNDASREREFIESRT